MTDPRTISDMIAALLDKRSPGGTICPSEVARNLGGDTWRDLMQPVRDVAAQRSDAGDLEVTRGGEKVDPRNPGGPIRLGRAGRAPLLSPHVGV